MHHIIVLRFFTYEVGILALFSKVISNLSKMDSLSIPRAGRKIALHHASLHLHPMAKRKYVKTIFHANLLFILSIISVILAVSVGFTLRSVKKHWTQKEVEYIGFFGNLVLRMLRTLTIPLIVSSLISSIGSLDRRISGHIGRHAILHYFISTVLAVILGIVIVTLIQPGRNVHLHFKDNNAHLGHMRSTKDADVLLDLIRNIFPENLIQATMQTYATRRNLTTGEWAGGYTDGTNVIGLISYCIALGIVIQHMNQRGLPLLKFARSLAEGTMLVTGWVVCLLPVGMFSLIVSQFVGESGDKLFMYFRALAIFFGVVVLGLSIHGFVVLPMMYAILTRKLPFHFLRKMSDALFTAFVTSSSAATLPVTLKCLEQKLGIDPRVTRLVVPIGAIMNMDGTALYEAVAAIWIAQMEGYDLDTGRLIVISVAAVISSMGAAGVPEAGLVTTIMVLNTVGLPAHYVMLIVPIDWLLDRLRTMMNVLGDSLGAAVIDHVSKEELNKLGPPDNGLYDDAHLEKLQSNTFSRISIRPSLKNLRKMSTDYKRRRSSAKPTGAGDDIEAVDKDPNLIGSTNATEVKEVIQPEKEISIPTESIPVKETVANPKPDEKENIKKS